MKYIDADLLLKDIDEFENAMADCVGKYADGFRFALEHFTFLITHYSRQEQQEVDLEKEIDECWQNWLSPSSQSSVEGVLPKSEFSMYARHFYELGKNSK